MVIVRGMDDRNTRLFGAAPQRGGHAVNQMRVQYVRALVGQDGLEAACGIEIPRVADMPKSLLISRYLPACERPIKILGKKANDLHAVTRLNRIRFRFWSASGHDGHTVAGRRQTFC